MEEAPTEDYPCPVEGCGKRFKRKEHLVRHGASHNNVKAFACGICGKSFARSDVLNRHVRQHNTDAPATVANATFNACDICHARKAKCTGGQPCQSCADHGLSCTRNRTVTRHRATKEAQKSLANPLTAPTTDADVQPSIVGWEDETLMEDVNLGSNTPSTVSTGPHPSSIPPSAFDDLPISLPRGISETQNYESSDVDRLSEICQIPVDSLVSKSPYEVGLQETLLDQFLVAYFMHLYQRWPMIHLMTFDKMKASPLLVWTLLMMGARCSPDQRLAREFADHLQTGLIPVLVRWLDLAPQDQAQLLPGVQAANHYVIFTLYFSNDNDLLQVWHINDLCLNCLRQIGAFDPQIWTKEIPWADPMNPQWVQIETRKRLTSMCFFANSYLGILLDKETTILYRELNCRLPCRNYWWWAMSREEIQRLRMADRPSDRTPKTMSGFILDTLADDKVNADVDVRELEVVDCHLVQCAIHICAWQANARGLDDTKRASLASNLDFWETRVEREFWKRQKPNAHPTELSPRTLLESVNLTLYNFSMINLYSDLRMITRYANMACLSPHSRVSTGDWPLVEETVSRWAESDHGRICAYQAGQILGHFINHGFTFRIGKVTVEPIPKVALFNAALVMWAFTIKRRSCSACISDSEAQIQAAQGRKGHVDTDFPYDPEFVKKWVAEGGAMTQLGITICRCQIQEIVGQFEVELHRYGTLDEYTRQRAVFITELQEASLVTIPG